MTFAADITRFVRKTQLSADVVLRKIALDAYSGLLRRSPVLTGRFRANWRVAINVVDTSTSSGTSRAAPASPPDGEELARAASKIQTAKFGDTIHLSNSLPYAGRLEQGWSKQAPNGVLNETLRELKANISRLVRELD